MTKVSVIIPVHNTEKYLKDCLNSVLNQTMTDIEVIAINDHSTDASMAILKFYQKLYPTKLKVIDMKEKYGVSSARNEGLKIAQGEFIGFVDSDDFISLNMFQDFYALARDYNTSLVIGHNQRVEHNAHFEENSCSFFDRKAPKVLDLTRNEKHINSLFCSCWDKLFSHELLLGEEFLENRIFEDVGFTFPISLKAKHAVEVQERDYFYRKNELGISSSSEKINASIFDIFYIALDARQRARKYGFSKTQMDGLDNLLKKAILCRLQFIARWDIEEKHKQFILEKALSACNYYFPNIKQIIANDHDVAQNAIMNLRNYGYEDLNNPRSALQQAKRAERMARTFVRK